MRSTLEMPSRNAAEDSDSARPPTPISEESVLAFETKTRTMWVLQGMVREEAPLPRWTTGEV